VFDIKITLHCGASLYGHVAALIIALVDNIGQK